jgi:hypothetical protein
VFTLVFLLATWKLDVFCLVYTIKFHSGSDRTLLTARVICNDGVFLSITADRFMSVRFEKLFAFVSRSDTNVQVCGNWDGSTIIEPVNSCCHVLSLTFSRS